VFLPKMHTTISIDINRLIVHTKPLDKFLGMVHVSRQLIRKPVKNDLTSNRPRIFSGPKLTTKNDYIFDGPNKPWKIFGAGEKNALFL
jgi:hypothetical protein